MPRKRLADDVRLEVVYQDETPFGSAIGGGADAWIRRACPYIFAEDGRPDMEDLVRRSNELLGRAFEQDLAPLYARPQVLREECLYPPADRVYPLAVVATREGRKLEAIGVEGDAVRELACWFGEFERGSTCPRSPTGHAMFDLLDRAGALVEGEPDARERGDGDDVVLVGHATAALRRTASILIDPYVLPTSPRYPASYQPLRVADLLPVDAVFVTHSHPDHFDVGTLLRLGADVPIYVPHVERESLLSIDMAARLEQLGFRHVERLRPGREIALGGARVFVHPFYGEQPTTGESLHPEVRNVGCTYSIVSGSRHILAVADSGRDRDGDVRDLAGRVRRQVGRPDVLLGGYRAFALYPIQYVFSSVARFVLFVPEDERATRIVPMNDGDALLDTAERCGAKHVVPYADGGAPWYWERGLGPRLDGKGKTNLSADPPPEEVLRRAAARSTWFEEPISSPQAVSIVRPGERLRIDDDGALRIERGARQTWPFARPKWHQRNVALARAAGSALESSRALFGALAPAVAVWRTQGRLERFFFMRKPPDLRLRFLGDDSLAAELSALLSRLVDEGHVDRYFESEYEPETARFGGPQAMAAVHAWFDADTAAWMRLDALDRRKRPDPVLMALAVTNDVVSALLADPAEAWAMWRSYAESFGLAEDRGLVGSVDLETLAATADLEMRALLSSYSAANLALVIEFSRLRDGGELSAGMRSILVAFVMFHLNRQGFDVAGHAKLVWTMIRALETGALGDARNTS